MLCGTRKRKRTANPHLCECPFLLGLCSGFKVAHGSNSNFKINQCAVEQSILLVMIQLACCAGAGHPLKGLPLARFYWGGMQVNDGWKLAGKLSSEMGSGGTNPKNSRLRSMEACFCFLNVGGQVPCSLSLPVNGRVCQICGLWFTYEQMLKCTLLGEQCLYRQRHLMLHEHPNFRNHLRGKLLLFPSTLETVCSMRNPEMQERFIPLPTVRTLKVWEK